MMRRGEQRVSFGEAGRLQGVLHSPQVELRQLAVLVLHPHPNRGGNMNNTLVVSIARRLAERGVWALRFNYAPAAVAGDKPLSEAAVEVAEAAAYLRQQLTEGYQLAVAGYSFGACAAVWFAASGEAPDLSALLLLALPVYSPGLSLPPLNELEAGSPPLMLINGAIDPLAPPAESLALLGEVGKRARQLVIDGADHFFQGKEAEAVEAAVDFLIEAGQPAG